MVLLLLACLEPEGKEPPGRGLACCRKLISGTGKVLVVDHLNATFSHHDVRKVMLLPEKPSMPVLDLIYAFVVGGSTSKKRLEGGLQCVARDYLDWYHVVAGPSRDPIRTNPEVKACASKSHP